MAERKFYGVDLQKNYGQAMLKEKEKVILERLRRERSFKTMAMHLEKILKKDTLVIDEELKKWMITGVKGRNIEKKIFQLTKVGGTAEKECDATEIFPLEVWLDAKRELETKKKLGWTNQEAYRRPKWFDICDQVKAANRK